jgi:DNA-binding NarL/FixJ family response regulator
MTSHDLDDALLKIQFLRVEVARLEHALSSAKLLAALLAPPAPVIQPLDLTPLEREVLARMIEGDSNQQISARQHICLGTVKGYVAKLMQKFNAQNRTGVVTAAVRAGFVPPETGAS